MSELENSGVVADLNKLFADRHELKTVTIDNDFTGNADVFAEVDEGGRRSYQNLTQSAWEAETYRLPAPRRAKGRSELCDLPRFIEAITQAHAAQWPVSIQVKRMMPLEFSSVAASAILNATLPDGTVGHGDHVLDLKINPDPLSQSWIGNLNRALPFTSFADLVYANGGAVVPKESQPKDVVAIAAMLKLDVASGIADLLNVCNGLEIAGETEETMTVDANTGDQRIVLAKKGKASVHVPTGVVINWEVFPNFCAAVLIRLTRQIVDGKAYFTLKPVNLESVQRHLAHEVRDHLEKAVPDVALQLVP